MAKMTVGKDVDQYIQQIEELEFRVPEIVGRVIYPGAKIVADEIRSEIEAIPADTTPNRQGHGVTPAEKEGLLEGLGIATLRRENGRANVKIGMDGYNHAITSKYPKGHPNAMVARSINAGTSFIRRNPFIDRATRRVKAAAEAAMQKQVDIEVSKIVKE